MSHTPTKRLRIVDANVPVWDSIGDRVYISCTESNSVAVIDCPTDSVVAHIGVGAAPIQMYVNAPSRRLYVLNWDGECVSIVDLNTLEVRNMIPTGGVPNCCGFSIVRNRFYVGGIGDSIVMIDGETDSVVGYAPFGPGATGDVLAVDRYGLLAVGRQNPYGPEPDTVHFVDAGTGIHLGQTSVPRGTGAMFYSELTDRLFCVGADVDSLAVLRGDGSGAAMTLAVGAAPFCFAYSRRARRLYIGCLNGTRVYVVRDTTTGVAEEGRSGLSRLPGVTVLGGVMRVGRAASLVDVTGRTVAELAAGENDVNGLSRGAYFVVSDGELVGKVLLVR